MGESRSFVTGADYAIPLQQLRRALCAKGKSTGMLTVSCIARSGRVLLERNAAATGLM